MNDNGELVGINSIIESYSAPVRAWAFCHSVQLCGEDAAQMGDGKTPEHAYLGVRLGTVTAANARQNDLSVTEGAYVGEVIDGSPADEAGIEKGRRCYQG